MKTLIRFISRTAAGAVSHNDKIVDADIITIGRATDQVLHLKDRRARLQHAEIRRQNGDFHISTAALAGVTVNGRSQRDVKLQPGDVIEVGANILRVIDAAGAADFAVSFELSGEARVEDMAADWTRATSGIGGFSKRKLAWTFAGLVFVFALLLPAAGLLNPGIASFMRGNALLPDDGLWLTGPLHSAHSSTSADCQNCHTALFTRVQDNACTACHSVDRHVAGGAMPVLGDVRCASCHQEHNEPQQLVNRHQGLCADCHKDLAGRLGGDVQLQDAADFLVAHPDFRISLLQPTVQDDGETQWNVNHVTLLDSLTADRSNVKFDHKVHLDAAGVVAPDGRRVLQCGDCHQPEPGGARMRPISMNDHCSTCHTLSFDADDPLRRVPHGDPAGVVRTLVEYYSARLLGDEPGAAEQRLRRPGQALTRADRDRAAAEARVRAMSVAADLFERRACVNCHEVSATGNADMPWRVEPVRLTAEFFPHANFSHAAHATEISSCDSCHKASASTSSADVLIPGLASCRNCHGSGLARRNEASQIPSTCIMCHSFHFAAKGRHQ